MPVPLALRPSPPVDEHPVLDFLVAAADPDQAVLVNVSDDNVEQYRHPDDRRRDHALGQGGWLSERGTPHLALSPGRFIPRALPIAGAGT